MSEDVLIIGSAFDFTGFVCCRYPKPLPSFCDVRFWLYRRRGTGSTLWSTIHPFYKYGLGG